jgi:hypothetical protein
MPACVLAGKIYGARKGWRLFDVERSMRGDERSNLNINHQPSTALASRLASLFDRSSSPSNHASACR